LKVEFQVCDLFVKTLKANPQVVKTFMQFKAAKATNPTAAFGSSDYPFRHSFLKGYIHAKLTFDVSIIYSISGGDSKVIKLYGIFSHDDSGTGQPPNLNRQQSLGKKLGNQQFT